jgi:transposase
MGSRRTFTSQFKRKVVQELGTRPVEEICREYELQRQLVYRWKREFETNPQEAFSGNGNVWKEDARIAQYERKIGQQAMQIDLLKKSIAHLTKLKEEERRKRRCAE